MTMTVHVATADQLTQIRELIPRKFSGPMETVFLRHLDNDVISSEQADHEIRDLAALPNRRTEA